jgi:hypothetical protein
MSRFTINPNVATTFEFQILGKVGQIAHNSFKSLVDLKRDDSVWPPFSWGWK